MTRDDELVEAIKTNWRRAELTERQHAMLSYSEKLTKTPHQMTKADADDLRQSGLNDKEVLAVVMLAGFFNLATRIADGLGVELDAELTRGTAEYERFYETTEP